MKRKSRGKKLFISVICLVLVAAMGLGIWYFTGSDRGEPVPVFPFYYMGMTEYWGDSQESYGFVQTDGVQTIYLSNTQTVTEIFVEPGQAVKKGDILMILEAMKMENEIVAPEDGVVASVAVAQGANVNTGDVLVVF